MQYLVKGDAYIMVSDDVDVAPFLARGYTMSNQAEVLAMKAEAIRKHVQQSDPKDAK